MLGQRWSIHHILLGSTTQSPLTPARVMQDTFRKFVEMSTRTGRCGGPHCVCSLQMICAKYIRVLWSVNVITIFCGPPNKFNPGFIDPGWSWDKRDWAIAGKTLIHHHGTLFVWGKNKKSLLDGTVRGAQLEFHDDINGNFRILKWRYCTI